MATDPLPPRTRSARLTLVSLLLIPLLSLTALWGFTASITLGNVIRDQQYNKVENAIAPSVIALAQTLAGERALTLIWLGTGRRSAPFQAQLLAVRHSTDTYAAAVRTSIMSVDGLVSTTARTRFGQFLAELAGLGQIRAAVDSGADSQAAAYNAYSAITAAEYGAFQISLPPGDPNLSLMTQSAIAEGRAEDFTGGAVALVEGALAARGLMPQPDRMLLAQTVGQQNLEISDMYSLADPAMTVIFKQIYDTPAYRQLLATENQIEASPPNRPIPVNPATVQATALAFQASVVANERQIGNLLAAQSRTLSHSLQTQLYLAGGLGLAALLASVFVLVRFGRRLRVELTNLYDSARQMANERLPRLVERLRRGEDVDVRAESPPMKPGRITEIANVAQAFATVQRTAIEAAVGQANLRKGVNQVFVHLSLRNQSLLHRQLGMLDTMERGTSDPALLGDLFGLDHLTTRMQRYAESLLILAGTTPGRGWRDPVPVADVLQAAVAEVEDYVRVDVIIESADAVAGIAVNDVIHLIAELVENATAFSPPNTRVTISGSVVGHGFAVEIEDRGLGIAPAALAAINEQLAIPPEFDLANSDQLGLFVTGKLAARHGIRVTLRMSPYRGTTAIVVLPWEIIVPEHEASAWFRPGGIGELSTAAANRERGLAFGMTGRHRLGLPPSPPEDGPEDGWADGTELAGGPQAPLAGTASWFSVLPPVAPDQPGPFESSPARAQSGSPMAAAAAWAIGPAEPDGFGGPTGVTGSTSVTGSAGVTGSAPGRPTNGTAANGTYLGLPRRVRQASLAPQLRGELGAEPGTSLLHPHEAAESSALSPEQTSSRLSALQDGWLRGRLDDLDSPLADPSEPDLGVRPEGTPGG
ncbi:MAG TPA: nitrate- and nitrite sensing domain-containing protein [Streptosporangiaceae bacterium]